MTSHLSISYGPSAPAGSIPAAVASAGDTAPTDGAAGFLAALIDQLLAGAAAPPAPAVPAATADPAAQPLDPSLNLEAQGQAKPPRDPLALLKALVDGLAKLKDELDAGETPDKVELKKLGDAADALAALIATPVVPTAALPADPTADPATPVPAGDIQPVAASPAPAPAIAELAQKLTSIGSAMASLAPDIADKLEALGAKLDAAAANPQLLAAFAPAVTDAASDAPSLDAIVRSLLEGKPPAPQPPPASPQLASADTALPLPPAPIARKTNDTADPRKQDDVAPVSLKAAPAPRHTLDTPPPPQPDPKPAPVAAPATVRDQPDADTVSASTGAVGPAAAAAPTPRALPAAYQTAQSPINMGQVAFEMVRQVRQGNSRFSIRLDPPELGRIDVKMHVDATGAVNARLTVERTETLDMFQRDRGTLERALTQAGLDSGKTNLEFSLRQNPFAGTTGGEGRPPHFAGSDSAGSIARDVEADPVPAVTLYRGTASAGGINLFV